MSEKSLVEYAAMKLRTSATKLVFGQIVREHPFIHTYNSNNHGESLLTTNV